ncbi:MAG: hypothetical protein ACYTBJ_14760 [Planctomycetota bacterium]
MIKPAVISLLALLAATSGCIYIHPAVETIVTVKQPDRCPDKSVMGLRDVVWSKTEAKLLLVGHGAHPREHETYMFFWNDGYPAFMPRLIRIISEEGQHVNGKSYRVELQLHGPLLPCDKDKADYTKQVLYVGNMSCRPRSLFGKLNLKLNNIKLSRVDDPTEAITLSGRLAAKRKSREKVLSASYLFDLHVNPDVDKNPDFIWKEEAIEVFGIPESVLSGALKKKPSEGGYLWTGGRMGGRMFYRKEEIERLAEGLGKR